MKVLSRSLDKIDLQITQWMDHHCRTFLRLSLSLIFIWFGALKYFPGLSPTIGLIEKTTELLTFGYIPGALVVFCLASIECLIGLGLLFNAFMRTTLLLLFLQMFATSTPIFILPEVVFATPPFGLTMEGHHIIKNLIIIGAGLVLGSGVRQQERSGTDPD